MVFTDVDEERRLVRAGEAELAEDADVKIWSDRSQLKQKMYTLGESLVLLEAGPTGQRSICASSGC